MPFIQGATIAPSTATILLAGGRLTANDDGTFLFDTGEGISDGGATPAAHASTHGPSGSDPLTTWYRQLSDVDFTFRGQALFDSVRATGPILTRDGFQTWNDPDFDSYPLIAFGNGMPRVYFADDSGGIAPDVAVGRSGVGIFSAVLGKIRADELGGASQDAAFFRNAGNINAGLLALARGGLGVDSSSIAANQMFASPNGSAGAPGWRSLVTTDVPLLPASKVTPGTFDSADTDITSYLGRVALFSATTDTAQFAHFDQATSSAYALRQSNAGVTSINAPTGQTININSNNSGMWQFDTNMHLIPVTDIARDFGNSTHRVRNAWVGGILRVGDQTNGSGLVVGSATASMNSLGSGVGLDLYADFNSTASGLLFVNPNVGTSAGLQQTFALATSTGVQTRAGSFRVTKNGAWTNGTGSTQNADFIWRQYIDGADTQFLQARKGALFLGSSTNFTNATAGDWVSPNLKGLRAVNNANTDTKLLVTLDTADILRLFVSRTTASVAANFSATNYIRLRDSAGNDCYIPCMTAAW